MKKVLTLVFMSISFIGLAQYLPLTWQVPDSLLSDNPLQSLDSSSSGQLQPLRRCAQWRRILRNSRCTWLFYYRRNRGNTPQRKTWPKANRKLRFNTLCMGKNEY